MLRLKWLINNVDDDDDETNSYILTLRVYGQITKVEFVLRIERKEDIQTQLSFGVLVNCCIN